MRRIFPFALILIVACDRGPRVVGEAEFGTGFVADDAGAIPLTSPGTAPRMEREVIGMPLPPPVDYAPQYPDEAPDFGNGEAARTDTIRSQRQQRASDTLQLEQQQPVANVPLVRPPQPTPPRPAPTDTPRTPRPSPGTTSPPATATPPPPTATPPPPAIPPDTGGGADAGSARSGGATHESRSTVTNGPSDDAQGEVGHGS